MIAANDQGVVTFSFHTSKKEGLLMPLIVLPIGALFTLGFWFGGVFDPWRRVLGWLPATQEVDQVLLVVPLLVLFPLVAYPLWVLVRVVVFGDRRRPQAFFFDNQARRLFLSETWATPPQDLAERQQLTGYGYEEIEGFGVRTYKTTMTRDSDSGQRPREVTHYVVGFWKTDGHFWDMEELLSLQEAETKVTEWEAAVSLKGRARPAPGVRELSPRVVQSSDGGVLTFAWKGRTPFGTAAAFLVGSGALGWVVTLLDRKFHSDGLLVLWFFVGAIAVMGLVLLFSSVRKTFVSHALRFSASTLEVGTLSAGRKFRMKAAWDIRGVTSVGAAFTLEMRRLKTRCLVLTGKDKDGQQTLRQQMDIAGVSLSQTVDLEHAIEAELRRRGAMVQ